ncbi:molybdenum cofactor guanylyltransferase [Kribbella deserti]|uniref:Molybdenum cofactor guanylyltransferase n=1 Tax=Kribbella deserti TaxID=1926257 RepID=A0ABV6QVL4_9ACTN
MRFDAVVLAGGRSSRFGGVDKAQLILDGVAMLDRVLAATAGAEQTVVVGPERATARPVTWATEDPPLGGPVAGIAAAVPLGTAPIVVIVSCDLPWLEAENVEQLVTGLAEYDGFGLRDSSGRAQRLAAAYRRTALERALAELGETRDQSVRRLFAGLALGWSGPIRAGDDVDTWADLDDHSNPGPG